MNDSPNRAIVLVYRDAAKTDLMVQIPIDDLGIVTDGQTVPTSDDGLIRMAKLHIDGTSDQDADGLHYEVVR